MTEKMYENLQEKYKKSVSQIFKICKIRTLELLATLILIRQQETLRAVTIAIIYSTLASL